MSKIDILPTLNWSVKLDRIVKNLYNLKSHPIVSKTLILVKVLQKERHKKYKLNLTRSTENEQYFQYMNKSEQYLQFLNESE
jgi:hypothetical protein